MGRVHLALLFDSADALWIGMARFPPSLYRQSPSPACTRPPLLSVPVAQNKPYPAQETPTLRWNRHPDGYWSGRGQTNSIMHESVSRSRTD
ncbi:hypothetical protein EV401DRAFT_2004905, partial [Pisolithus croceorrhizus]